MAATKMRAVLLAFLMVYDNFAEGKIDSEKQIISEYLTSNKQLAKSVYRQLSSTETGNFVFSPFSLQCLLYIITAGASGETAEQIRLATGLSTNHNTLGKLFDYVQNTLKVTFDLDVLHKVYVDLLTPNSAYVRWLKTFETNFRYIHDFNQIPEQINEWITSQTQNNLMSIEDRIDLLIASTAEYRGEWKYPFRNFLGSFTASQEQYVNVSYMISIAAEIGYFEDNVTKMLEIPFINDNVKLYIILPEEGYDKLIDSFNNSYSFVKSKVFFRIPKDFLAHASEIKLKPVLKSLGIRLGFSDLSNFENLSKVPSKIDDVLQNNMIKIDVEGMSVSSASVGAIKKTSRSVRIQKENFFANRPFSFCIMHRHLGVLFMGRYAKPIIV